jgi:hypothetical protein
MAVKTWYGINLFVYGLLDLYSEEHGRTFQTDLSRPNE